MNKKIFFSIAIAILLAIYCYTANSMEKRDRKNYDDFNKSNLNGSITGLEEFARGIKLHLESKIVVFYPQTSQLNDNNIFIFTAKVGDKVIKKQFQDTLILQKKNGLVFKYTFFKF
ncbi:hypothetical protein [Chryseobacterium sp. ISL-6]|uniref:hypothetical protein n=1 Tax=Chryseobacterium sp. ISL-6 TaxID=2819143 RepID=UPI001BE806C5|nr:hypothetical protein [Chryseobacterium sp. ISL-6]MBT2623304.1 hypothetical protein [Chryseobacterium sp. ISL-6]